MYRLGLYGGAFDPPHKGHLNIASATVDNLILDKLIIIPSGMSPHKAPSRTQFKARFEMCRLAFSHIAEISDIENKSEDKSYTLNTIKKIKDIYPKAKIYLIIGSDMLFSFKQWYKYEEILKLCKIVSAARNHNEYEAMSKAASGIAGDITILNLKAVPVSSSEIREKIKKGENWSEYLSDNVKDYIDKHELYN